MTTYVLGAGASVNAGFPLATDMAAKLLAFMRDSGNDYFCSASRFLTDCYGDPENIEELLTNLENRVDELEHDPSPEARTERTSLGNARGALTAALKQWFSQLRVASSGSYADFAEEVVVPGDVIVTFNYDDLPERELRSVGKWDLSTGYGFQLSDDIHASSVPIFKLHGSANWLISYFGGKTGFFSAPNPSSMGSSPVIHRADAKYLGYESFDGHVYSSGGASPCMILPTRSKRFFYTTSLGREFEEFWSFLWSQAERAIRESARIVICGYSVLPVDRRACDLLFQNPRKEVEILVVSGRQSDRIAGDFRSHGFTNVKVFDTGYFADWVKYEIKSKTDGI